MLDIRKVKSAGDLIKGITIDENLLPTLKIRCKNVLVDALNKKLGFNAGENVFQYFKKVFDIFIDIEIENFRREMISRYGGLYNLPENDERSLIVKIEMFLLEKFYFENEILERSFRVVFKNGIPDSLEEK